jgi:hypothetical protein
MRRQGLDIVFLAYGIGDLQHGSGSGSLVAAHDVLELDIQTSLLFGTEDGAADDGGVLLFGEVLYRVEVSV